MENDDLTAADLVALEKAHDSDLAIARNVATNGRLFCSLIAAIALASFFKLGDVKFAQMAIIMAVPVGASCIIDQLPNGFARIAASVSIYWLAGFMAAMLFIRLSFAG